MKKIKIIEHCFFLLAISLLFYKKIQLQSTEQSPVAVASIKKGDSQDRPTKTNNKLKQTAALLPSKDSRKKP